MIETPETGSPIVSVIVPAYNRRDYLRLTLESVKAQTFTRFEVIVVDDGSTDGSAEVAEEFAAADTRFHCVRQENGGSSTARNHGLRLSAPEAQYVVFLDSDDLWTPNALQSLMEVFDRNPDATIAYSPIENVGIIDHAGVDLPHDRDRFRSCSSIYREVFGRDVPPEEYNAAPFLYMVTYCIMVSPGAALLKKTALSGIEFDSSLLNCEDWDFWIRIAEKNKFHMTPDKVFYYRVHDGAQTTNYARAKLSREKIYEKFSSSPEYSEETRTLFRQALVKHFQLLALFAAKDRKHAVKTRNWKSVVRETARVFYLRGKALRMGRGI